MKIDQYYIGQTASLTKRFTTADVETFAQLSSDCNPLHLDIEYAEKGLFQQRIVHGFLVGSLISAVLGTQLPGPGAIYLHQDLNFRKPVYHNDTITAIVAITDVVQEKSILHFTTKCINQNNDIVIEGTAILKII